MYKRGLLCCLAVLLASIAASAGTIAQDKAALDAPKGHLFIIGGGDRLGAMMKRFVDLAAAHRTGKIVVFTMASSVPEETGPGLVEEFKKLGAPAAEFHHLTREQALDPESVRLLPGGRFSAAGLVLHILAEGQRFDLRARKVLN